VTGPGWGWGFGVVLASPRLSKNGDSKPKSDPIVFWGVINSW
jgi:hypothetical protein